MSQAELHIPVQATSLKIGVHLAYELILFSCKAGMLTVIAHLISFTRKCSAVNENAAKITDSKRLVGTPVQ